MMKKSKSILRNEILKIRNNLPLKDKEEMDNSILKILLQSDLYKNSKNIFTYVSYGSEVDTKLFIIKALQDKKRVFVPKVNNITKTMNAIEISSLNELFKNYMGILEPKDDNYIDKNEIDLIIMPGLVFDYNGNRIGYGGGYYDKYLENISEKIKKVAITYSFQLVSEIQAKNYDVKVDYIINENKILNL